MTKKELKKFGLTMAVFFIAFGILFRLKSHLFVAVVFAVIGFLFALFTLALPKALKPIHFIWMKFSMYLGFVMSKVILGIIFYLLVTPLGFLKRIFKGDFLDLKIEKSKKSYWHYRSQETTKNSYEKQF